MILLDTHVLLWMASDPSRLSRRAQQAIRDARQTSSVAAATISLWEVAWLAHHQRILIAGSIESFTRELISRVILRPQTPEIASLAVRLPAPFPKDPADRLITATAMVEGMTLITADALIRKAKIVDTVW